MSKRPPKVYSINGLAAWEFADELRPLGCLPPREEVFAEPFEASHKILSPKDWQERNLCKDFPTKVKDQGRTSACNGFATATAAERAWQLLGQEPEELSPYWCYGLVNHGRDQGSTIEDMVHAVKKYGFAREEEVPKGKMYKNQFSQETFQKAQHRQAINLWQLRSFAEICTALTLGFPCVIGIEVGRNFGNLDDEGVCPLPDYTIGGHAISLCGLYYSSKKKKWLPVFQNSWGSRWGLKGFAALTEEHCLFYGRVHAFALESLEDNSLNTEDDPPMVSKKKGNKKDAES